MKLPYDIVYQNESTDELAGEWTIEEYDLPTGDVGETATFTVTTGKFMRAKVGFKVEVPADK